jgi:internalin A
MVKVEGAYEAADGLIRQAARNKGSSLHLSHHQLTRLPPGIGRLTHLQRIDLNGNELTELPIEITELNNLLYLSLANNKITAVPREIGHLADLRHLYLGSNELTELSPAIGQLRDLQHFSLTSNQLTHLPREIGLLTNLQYLDLTDNQLTALPPEIGQLTNLQQLNLTGNRLTALPSEIGQLTNLKNLYVGANQLAELPSDLHRLTNLQTFHLTFNHLTSLPPDIGELGNLQTLDLDGNQLRMLPRELARLSRTIHLLLRGNPLRAPLPELLERGTPALFSYLHSLASAGPQYEAKVLLVGEGNVGKTSLIAALQGNPFVPNRPTTHGIQIGTLIVDHPELPEVITLNTWDFGGQEVYRITHQFFFSRRALYVLVWRPREGQEENAIEGWCKRIKLRVGDYARVLVVATHADERRPELDFPYLKRQFGELIADHQAVDNQSGSGIEQLRVAIAAEAAELPQMGELISERWIAARDDLKGRPDPQISYDEFANVCTRHGLDESQTATLAGLLHDLGHIIHYAEDEGLRDVVVLQPEWLTKAIGYVLEDRKTEAAGGVLSHTRLKTIWQDPTREESYPSVYHPYFLRLMEKFDVSYRIPDEDASLVAQLVRYQEPELIWRRDDPLPPQMRSLSLVCRMEESAPGLIAWLTVRNHRFSIGQHWRRGVFLEHQEHAAQALFMLHGDKQLTLTVRAPSPDYLFSVLRDSLEDLIRRRWKGLDYELLIPCPQLLPDGSRCSGQFELQTLQKYRERDRVTIDCPRCIEPQSVTQLLTGFASPELPLQRVLDELREQSEEVKVEVRKRTDEVKADQQVVAAHAADIANQMRMLLQAVSVEINDCPRLFSLVPKRPKRGRASAVVSDHYRLTLWCEHPGREHPWESARYDFSRPKEWLRDFAPYALMVSRLLRAAVPVGSAVLAVAIPEEKLKSIEKELGLMEALVQQLPETAPEDVPDVGALGDQVTAEGAGLRALRALLVELDPTMQFGDLRRVLSPAGDYLWVCPTYHYSEYDPGLPSLPG